jgi:hypothetical protein
MAIRHRPGKVAHMYKLDSKPYSDSVKNAGKAADRVLRRYGDPTLSLAELRTRVARELGEASLADLVLKEREAGW